MVVAEPHHADPMLLAAPSRRVTMVTSHERRDDVPEHTTVTGGVVEVIAVAAEA